LGREGAVEADESLADELLDLGWVEYVLHGRGEKQQTLQTQT
jgi:hypothetical protein